MPPASTPKPSASNPPPPRESAPGYCTRGPLFHPEITLAPNFIDMILSVILYLLCLVVRLGKTFRENQKFLSGAFVTIVTTSQPFCVH